MTRWLTYFKERFPLPVYLILACGLTLSGLFLDHGRFGWHGFLLSFFGLLLFFFQLRLMDEIKDYEKDVIAHPERPLPRGLVSVTEASRVIAVLMLGMLLYALASGFLANWTACLSYLAITGYLWLMYREFYTGGWLDERPFLYALTHQVITLFVAVFAVAVTRPQLALEPQTLYLGGMIIGAFLCYEVCRKLDPQAHPVLKTYLSVYGLTRTIAIAVLALLLAAYGAWGLGWQLILWPLEVVVFLSMLVLYLKPAAYKITEGMATLSLMVHLWIIVIQHFTGLPK